MIGIIGGIGPAAGLNLARQITEQIEVQKDQDHLPWILMNQPERIVDRTEFLIGKVDENPGHEIANQILSLEKIGCTVAGIACNTAHAPEIFNLIKNKLEDEASKIHIVHAIDEMVGFALKNLDRGEKVGIIGTTGSYLNRLHSNPLNDEGFDVIDPGMEIQEELIHKAIYHPKWGIKARPDPPSVECLESLQKVIDFYRSKRVSAIVLGCSEISLVIDHLDTDGLTQLRPMTILAAALGEIYLKNKRI